MTQQLDRFEVIAKTLLFKPKHINGHYTFYQRGGLEDEEINKLIEAMNKIIENESLKSLATKTLEENKEDYKDCYITFERGDGFNTIGTLSVYDFNAGIIAKEIKNQIELDNYARKLPLEKFEKDILKLDKIIKSIDTNGTWNDFESSKYVEKALEIQKTYSKMQKNYINFHTKSPKELENIYQFLTKNDKRFSEFKEFENQIIDLNKKIKDFENKRMILTPQAKESKIKEIKKEAKKIENTYDNLESVPSSHYYDTQRPAFKEFERAYNSFKSKNYWLEKSNTK